jgi:hypothetical protein
LAANAFSGAKTRQDRGLPAALSRTKVPIVKERFALLVLLLSGVAGAQDDFATARLEWQRAPGAEECVTRDALSRAVAERLARDPFVASGGDIVVRGKVRPLSAESGWSAELELVTSNGALIGTRTLQTEAEHCSALDESLPLVLALMLDVPRDEVRRADERKAAAAPKPEPPRTTPIALPRTVHAPREPWRFRAAALATGAVGLLPEPALGAGVTLGVEPPTFWLTELDATIWLPRDAEQDGGGARYRLLAVALHLCPFTIDAAPLRLDLCAGQRLGRLEASGFGFERNRDQIRLIYDVSVRARGWLELFGPVGLLFGVGAEVPLARDRFYFVAADGRQPELFRMSPLIGVADIGLGVSLP